MMASQQTLAVSVAAKKLYENQLRHDLEANHLHSFVAIEPISGEYYLGDTLSSAIQAARKEHPERLSFALRIGHESTVQMGELLIV